MDIRAPLLLGGAFKYFLCSPLFGEDSHFDEYFSDGLKPPTSDGYQSSRLHIYTCAHVHVDWFFSKVRSNAGKYIREP